MPSATHFPLCYAAAHHNQRHPPSYPQPPCFPGPGARFACRSSMSNQSFSVSIHHTTRCERARAGPSTVSLAFATSANPACEHRSSLSSSNPIAIPNALASSHASSGCVSSDGAPPYANTVRGLTRNPRTAINGRDSCRELLTSCFTARLTRSPATTTTAAIAAAPTSRWKAELSHRQWVVAVVAKN